MASECVEPRVALPGWLAEDAEDTIIRAGWMGRLVRSADMSHDDIRSVLACELVPTGLLRRMASAMTASGVPAMVRLAADVRNASRQHDDVPASTMATPRAICARPLSDLVSRAGLTMTTIADRMGVTPSTLRMAARDGIPPLGAVPPAGRPRAVTVESIAAALRLSAEHVARDLAPLVARWEARAQDAARARAARRADGARRLIVAIMTAGERAQRGEALRRVCDRLGIVRSADLAARLGCSGSTARECMRRGFRAEGEPGHGITAKTIATALGVPVAELLGG